MDLLNSSGQIINFNAEIPSDFEFLFEPKRYKVVYGGRGKGASWGFADALLIIGTQVIPCYPNPTRNLCTRELQKSITDSVHKLLCDRISALGLEEFYNINQKMISGLNGTEFLFGGLKHNVREIKSKEGIDFAWVEEAENVSNESWEVLIPTVRKEGSEIWVSFNTKQPTDATYRRMIMDADDDYIVKKLSYRDNPFFPEVLEKERLRLKAKDIKAYEHVWEGEFDLRYSGAVYAKWIAELKDKGRICDRVKYDPEYPVFTLWDLGYGDTNAIWFYQEAPNEVYFFDYYENNGEGIGHYCDILKDKEYKYRANYVPQDAGRKLLEANGRSIVEQAWKDHGVRLTIVPETTHANRHQGLRKVLPSCFFNSETCAEGLEALMAYHYEYDEDLQIFKKIPVHDWSSHASCALELLPSVWANRAVTQKEVDTRAINTKFHRLRRENKLDKVDPYRVKPMGKR